MLPRIPTTSPCCGDTALAPGASPSCCPHRGPGGCAGACVLTHLDRLSFPAAKWLCTVCQRPLAAFPMLGSLWAEMLLLRPSSPPRCFSPGRPSRSPASPAVADAVSLAPDNREPLGRAGGRTPPDGHEEGPDGQTDTWGSRFVRGTGGVGWGTRGRGGGGERARGGQTDKRRTDRERERETSALQKKKARGGPWPEGVRGGGAGGGGRTKKINPK